MLRDSRGDSQHSGNRQVVAPGMGFNEANGGGGESVLDNRDVSAELKKTVMRW